MTCPFYGMHDRGLGVGVVGVEMEAFARKLIESCETHDAWLSVVRFGLGTLLKNQSLLIQLIVCEAERMSQTRSGETQVNEARRIRDAGLGVCSECPGLIEDWDARERGSRK